MGRSMADPLAPVSRAKQVCFWRARNVRNCSHDYSQWLVVIQCVQQLKTKVFYGLV